MTRESQIRFITSLRKYYRPLGMDLVINQALIGKASMDQLDDDELAALLRNVDRARECIRDGISFEDAGLIHNGY